MKIQRLHRWQVATKEAIEIQRKLQKMISYKSFSGDIHLVAGTDASFSKKSNSAHGAVCIFSFPDLELVEQRAATIRLQFPYVPGLLTFREGPVLLKCFEEIQNIPDVIIFDGQGIMHPRWMGIATHLGILLDAPTIGCAKSHLYGIFKEPAGAKGSYENVKDRDDRIIGACLRTRNNVKPVFVSIGNKIELPKALDIILSCAPKYRIPEPVRSAHWLADSMKLSAITDA